MSWWFFPEAVMSLGLAGAGLLLDIVGVCLLLLTTSMKRIEAELAFNMMKLLTDAREERRQAGALVELSELDSEEHKHRLSTTEQIVHRNHRWMRVALVLIVVGFLLQLLDSVRRSPCALAVG